MEGKYKNAALDQNALFRQAVQGLAHLHGLDIALRYDTVIHRYKNAALVQNALFRQAVQGLAHLHGLDIAHRYDTVIHRYKTAVRPAKFLKNNVTYE